MRLYFFRIFWNDDLQIRQIECLQLFRVIILIAGYDKKSIFRHTLLFYELRESLPHLLDLGLDDKLAIRGTFVLLKILLVVSLRRIEFL